MKRPLTDEEKQLLLPTLVDAEVASPDVCETALERCRLVRRLPSLFEIHNSKSALAYVALRTCACGVALGDEVHIRADFFDRHQNVPLRVVAHEVTHVAQFRRDGAPQFLMRYLRDYAAGLAQGLGERRAYLAISYEREARRVADAVATVRN